MIQPNLFDEPDDKRPEPPPKALRPTSQQARESVAEDGPRIRNLIWDFLEGQGERGATDAEIQHALGISGDTERPKRLELYNARLIGNSGRTRPTPTGRDAIVWTIAKFAKELAQADVPKPAPKPKQHRLLLSPDRERIERRAAEREQTHGPILDRMPPEDLESLCTEIPGWPRLFGKAFTPDAARQDPVCRRLLLAMLADSSREISAP